MARYAGSSNLEEDKMIALELCDKPASDGMPYPSASAIKAPHRVIEGDRFLGLPIE